MARTLAGRVEALLCCAVVETRPQGGGCIGESSAVRIEGGERLFVKDYAGGPAGMPSAEAHGLAWLAGAGALPVAKVRAHSDEAGLLLLEWIESGRPGADFDERLGRGLAALHATAPPGYGLERDNFIGSLPQSNAPADCWAEFYRGRRLEPMLRRAADAGVLPARLARRAGALLERLPDLCGPEEGPARLHGDLWGGNLMTDAEGRPRLIDPAVYAGHREMDLAMMRLFGGYSQRTFDAYAEAFPLAPGARERIPLCQLYPLLVHVLLFGGHYVGSFAGAMDAYL